MDRYTIPEWEHTALLTIDTQRDFTLPGAPAQIAGTADVLPAMARLLAAFRAAGRPVVHVVRLYETDGANVDLCRRELIAGGKRIVAPGSDGAELADDLKPDATVRLDAPRLLAGAVQPLGPDEWAMYKPRWSAFYATPLAAHLRDLGVTTVVVCGCNYPNCPRATLYDASNHDFRVVFVTDATSGVYDQGLRELTGIGVALHRTDEAVAAVRG